MASVNPQSFEDLPWRTIYRFPATRFEQVATLYENTTTPGLKTLVNQDSGATTSLVIPATNQKAKYFTIEFFFKPSVILRNNAIAGFPYVVAKTDFLRIEFSATEVVNFDGKPTQTKFYESKNLVYYNSSALRSVAYGSMQLEPSADMANYLYNSNNVYDITTSVSQLICLLYPVVTFYK